MNVKKLAWSLLTLLTTVLPAARADTWAEPTPRIYANKAGSHGFTVVPARDPFGKPATGTLFIVEKDGKQRAIWQQELVNQPYRVFLSDLEGQVVTVDTYANLGFKHALVVYDHNGKAVADFALEDIIPKEEIAAKVRRTVSSRHWTNGATLGFSDDGKQFLITLEWGRAIRVDLKTGKLVKK